MPPLIPAIAAGRPWNFAGEIIAPTWGGFKKGQGIGFAIPVKRISESLAEIYTPEIVKSLWFGATFQARGSEVLVGRVEPGSPAEAGGLRPGDTILKLNNKPPRSIIAANRELI